VAMVLLALALWLLATVVVAIPASLVLRHLDGGEVEPPVDEAELNEAMSRHPSQRANVA
jgi:hypothetical protein